MRLSILPLLLIPLALAACSPTAAPLGGGAPASGDAPVADGSCASVLAFEKPAAVTEAEVDAAFGFDLPDGGCAGKRDGEGTFDIYVYYLGGDQAIFDELLGAVPGGGWILQGEAQPYSAIFSHHPADEGILSGSDLPPDLVNDYIYLDYEDSDSSSYLPDSWVRITLTDASE